MKTHTIILFALAVMATALPAQAAEWWFVNVRDDSRSACIKVKETPEGMADEMRQALGAANVRVFRQPVHAGGEPNGAPLGTIVTVIIEEREGTSQFPLTTSRPACEAAIQRVVAAEYMLDKVRQEIAAGTRASKYKPPAEPWYTISEAMGRCVKLSDAFDGVHTPQQLAAHYARAGQKLDIRPGASPDIVGLFEPSGAPAFMLVRGADTCKIAMALSARRR